MGHARKVNSVQPAVRCTPGKLSEALRRSELRSSATDRDRGTPRSAAHRVAGGSHPPPAPTERSLQIYRTALFGRCFTAQRYPATSYKEETALVAQVRVAP